MRVGLGLIFMKKLLKILLTIAFVIGFAFVIYNLSNNYSENSLLVTILAFAMFCMHLFSWLAPKTFFNLCWRITDHLPDRYDYDRGYKNLAISGLVILIISNILLLIGILII